MKWLKNSFFAAVALLVIMLVFGTFFGLSDWLESKGVSELLAFYGPLLTGIIGGVVVNHYRPKWFD